MPLYNGWYPDYFKWLVSGGVYRKFLLSGVLPAVESLAPLANFRESGALVYGQEFTSRQAILPETALTDTILSTNYNNKLLQWYRIIVFLRFTKMFYLDIKNENSKPGNSDHRVH